MLREQGRCRVIHCNQGAEIMKDGDEARIMRWLL